jgi:hypothetical protein
MPNPGFNHNTALFPPKDYKGVLIYEEVYAYLLKKYDEFKKRQQKQQGKILDPGMAGTAVWLAVGLSGSDTGCRL